MIALLKLCSYCHATVCVQYLCFAVLRIGLYLRLRSFLAKLTCFLLLHLLILARSYVLTLFLTLTILQFEFCHTLDSMANMYNYETNAKENNIKQYIDTSCAFVLMLNVLFNSYSHNELVR